MTAYSEAAIRDGRYDTSESGNGFVGGPHIVRISGFDGVAPNDDAPYGRPVFLGYEETADLPEGTANKDFDVPASAAP